MNTMNQQPPAVSNDKDTLVEDVRALMAATAHMAEEKVAEARKRLAAALDSGGEIIDRIQGKALDGAKYTDNALHEHPYPAVIIALGVGVLIGHLATHQYPRQHRWLH